MATAQEVVSKYTVDAPVNIEGLIEAFGIELDRKADLHPEIAGQIEKINDGNFRISVNKNDHYYRKRFTLAHELAHYLLHRSLIANGLDDTKAYRSLNIGKFNNQNVTPLHEVEANRFAARVLMPKHLIMKYFKELNGNTTLLAKKFQVSEQAMNYRLQALLLR